jgi:phosphoglycolate phosphatase-like HAD superfamily hydrolase
MGLVRDTTPPGEKVIGLAGGQASALLVSRSFRCSQRNTELQTPGALIFDFDGVIIESVEIKNQAMARIFEDDPQHTAAILDLNERMGGISRMVKFQEVYRTILHRAVTQAELDAHAVRFQRLVIDEVIACPWVSGAVEFLTRNSSSRPLFLLSGTPHPELEEVVDARNLRQYFTEVHGSPPGKPETVRNILARHHLAARGVTLIGDAPLDQEAARATGIQFIGRVAPGQPSPFLPGTHTIPDLHKLEETLAIVVS